MERTSDQGKGEWHLAFIRIRNLHYLHWTVIFFFLSQLAQAVVDPLLRKRLANNGDTPTVTKTALQVTAPLAHIPYDQQIQQKNDEAVKQLRSYAQIIKTVNRQLRETVEVRQTANDGLPCRWHGFKASPHISEYRNKNEFTIGKNAEGEKVVGFRLSSYADGSVQVGSIDNLPHVPERAKQAAKVYEGFIGASKYDVFNPEFYTGRFRQLTVRLSAMTQELMIIVGVHTTVGAQHTFSFKRCFKLHIRIIY